VGFRAYANLVGRGTVHYAGRSPGGGRGEPAMALRRPVVYSADRGVGSWVPPWVSGALTLPDREGGVVGSS